MPEKNVKVMLRGGLGNQLFQYGAGLGLSRRLGVPLDLDCSLLPIHFESYKGVSRWPEQISSFNHSGELMNTGSGIINSWVRTRSAQIERSAGDRFPKLFYRAGIYPHEMKDPIDPLLNALKPMRLNAYCNSAEFFENVAAELRTQIRDLVKPSDWFEKNRDQIITEKPIAVHLRLGDYRNLESVFGRLGKDYFEKCGELIENLSGNCSFVFFSDEPEIAESFFKSTRLAGRVIAAPPYSPPLESVLLMSQCQGLIASNSSFSWWAGYLMENPKKPVVFPRPLFNTPNRPDPKNWLLDHWLQTGNPS